MAQQRKDRLVDDRWRPNMSIPVIGLDRDGTINEDIGLTQEGVSPIVLSPTQF